MTITTGQELFVPNRIKLDQVRLVAYAWKKKPLNISDTLMSVSLTDDLARSAVEAQLTFYDNINFSATFLAPGTWLALWFFNPETKKWDYPLKLVVWSRGVTDSNRRTTSVSAFDIVSFLHRSGPEDWLFTTNTAHPKGWTASDIAKFVLTRMKVPYNVAPTQRRIKYLKLTSLTPYEAIVKAYSRHRELTDERYTIRADQGKIAIKRLNIRTEPTWAITQGLNLISADWEESLEKKVTQAVARSVDKDGNVTRKAVYTSPDSVRYGVMRKFVDTDKDLSPAELRQMAKKAVVTDGKMARTATVECEGLFGVRAGNVILINDRGGTNLVGRFYADSVEHHIEPGNHTMTIDLSWVARVPSSTLSKEEIDANAGQIPPGSEVSFPDPYSGRPFMNPLGRAKWSGGGSWHSGSHTFSGQNANWQSSSAIDMFASEGTPVYSAFTGKIVRINRAHEFGHSSTRFGVQLTIQNPENTLAAFYTHIENVPKELTVGKNVPIGTQIGTITRWDGGQEHLHFALYNGPWTNQTFARHVNPEPLVKQAPTSADESIGTVPPPGRVGSPVTGTDERGYRQFARKLAVAYRIDPNLFERQINAESGFNPYAQSGAGAQGIAQIVPKAHPIMRPYVYNPYKSLNYAAHLMAYYLSQYQGRWDKALAAYNAGVGGASRYIKGGAFSTLPSETQNYITSITGTSNPTKQTYGAAPNVGGNLKYPPGITEPASRSTQEP